MMTSAAGHAPALADRFDLPEPPGGLVFPQAPQLVATAAMGLLVVGFLGYGVAELLRRRSPVLLLLLAGGAVSYLNEPIDDVLGLLWHPRPGQWQAIDTFGPAPLWGLGIYTVFFGGLPYVVARLVRRRAGITPRQLWAAIGAFLAIDLAVEIPLLSTGLYVYFGDPPYSLGGLPLYWLLINVAGPLALALVLLRFEDWFAGPRLALLPLLPMSFNAGGSVAVGWPIFSALGAQAPTPVKYAAGALSMLIGVVALHVWTMATAAVSRGLRSPEDAAERAPVAGACAQA